MPTRRRRPRTRPVPLIAPEVPGRPQPVAPFPLPPTVPGLVRIVLPTTAPVPPSPPKR